MLFSLKKTLFCKKNYLYLQSLPTAPLTIKKTTWNNLSNTKKTTVSNIISFSQMHVQMAEL